MQVSRTRLPEVLLVRPQVHGDARGFFMETYNHRRFVEATGLDVRFVQDNHSRSTCSVLRGLHYQLGRPQGKLVRVIHGQIFDVAVDLRRSSPRFGQWCGQLLDGEQHEQLWIPPGFAHGFLVLSDRADVAYKTTDYYAPDQERSLRWNDPALGIEWPLVPGREPQLSGRDRGASLLAQAETYD